MNSQIHHFAYITKFSLPQQETQPTPENVPLQTENPHVNIFTIITKLRQ